MIEGVALSKSHRQISYLLISVVDNGASYQLLGRLITRTIPEHKDTNCAIFSAVSIHNGSKRK